MGFFKSLQRKAELKTEQIKAKMESDKPKSSSDVDEAYYEFEDHYGNTCDKKEAKIYNIDTHNPDPDKNIKAFQKMLDLCHELEEYCNSKGSGGAAYFKENYSYIYQDIQNDFDDYMKNEYAEDKEFFEEQKAYEKALKNLSKKILKEIQKSGGSIMQTKLKKLISETEMPYYNRSINELTESGKIERFKIESHVAFRTTPQK